MPKLSEFGPQAGATTGTPKKFKLSDFSKKQDAPEPAKRVPEAAEPEDTSLAGILGDDTTSPDVTNILDETPFGLGGRTGFGPSPGPGSQLESLVSGGKQGALSITAALAKLIDSGGSKELIENVAKSEAAKTKAVSEDFPLTSLAGEIGGELAITGGVGPFGKGKLAQIFTGALTGAGVSSLSASGRGDNAVDAALFGAGVSGGLGALTEAGKAIFRRLANAKGGQFQTEEIAELIRIGEQQGVKVFTDDASKSTILKKLSTVSENVPFSGVAKGRQQQNVTQLEAAKRLASKAASGVDDFGEVLQSELSSRLKQVKKKGSELFDKASRSLDPFGSIPKDEFKLVLQQGIDVENAAGTLKNQDLVKLLTRFRDSPDGGFSTIRSQRSELGDEISKFYKGDASAVGSKGVGLLQAAKQALDGDIQSFVDVTGSAQGKRAFDVANQFHINKLVPFKKTRLKQLINENEPEKIVSFLTGARNELGRKSRAELLGKNITPKGRQVLKGALLDQALARSGGRDISENIFNSGKFADEMNKLQNVTGVLFKGKEKDELDGIIKLMKATERAGQLTSTQTVGNRFLVPVVGASLLGIAKTIGSISGFGAAMKGMLQTNTGRGLLLGLSKTTENTAAWERSINRINKFLSRGIATAQQQR